MIPSHCDIPTNTDTIDTLTGRAASQHLFRLGATTLIIDASMNDHTTEEQVSQRIGKILGSVVSAVSKALKSLRTDPVIKTLARVESSLALHDSEIASGPDPELAHNEGWASHNARGLETQASR